MKHGIRTHDLWVLKCSTTTFCLAKLKLNNIADPFSTKKSLKWLQSFKSMTLGRYETHPSWAVIAISRIGRRRHRDRCWSDHRPPCLDLYGLRPIEEFEAFRQQRTNFFRPVNFFTFFEMFGLLRNMQRMLRVLTKKVRWLKSPEKTTLPFQLKESIVAQTISQSIF